MQNLVSEEIDCSKQAGIMMNERQAFFRDFITLEKDAPPGLLVDKELVCRLFEVLNAWEFMSSFVC